MSSFTLPMFTLLHCIGKNNTIAQEMLQNCMDTCPMHLSTAKVQISCDDTITGAIIQDCINNFCQSAAYNLISKEEIQVLTNLDLQLVKTQSDHKDLEKAIEAISKEIAGKQEIVNQLREKEIYLKTQNQQELSDLEHLRQNAILHTISERKQNDQTISYSIIGMLLIILSALTAILASAQLRTTRAKN